MTQQEILEYNKRCAEFLNYEFDELSETYKTPHLKLVEPLAFADEQFSCRLKIFELDFHSDWNWIMEVIEDIEKLKYLVEIQSNFCQIQEVGSKENNFQPSIISQCYDDSKKEAVVQAINQFLIWYNEHTSKL